MHINCLVLDDSKDSIMLVIIYSTKYVLSIYCHQTQVPLSLDVAISAGTFECISMRGLPEFQSFFQVRSILLISCKSNFVISPCRPFLLFFVLFLECVCFYILNRWLTQCQKSTHVNPVKAGVLSTTLSLHPREVIAHNRDSVNPCWVILSCMFSNVEQLCWITYTIVPCKVVNRVIR